MLRSVLAALFVVSFCFSDFSLALPFPARNDKIPESLKKKLAKVPELEGVQIYLDHQYKTIWVSPASRSSQGGAFRFTGYARCDGLKNLYDLIYSMPPKEKMLEIALSKESGGPFFDYHYGFRAFAAPIYKKLSVAMSQVNEFDEAHSAELVELKTIDKEYQSVLADISSSEAKMKELNDKIFEAAKNISNATSKEEREDAKEVLAEARKHREAEKTPINKQLYAANNRKQKLMPLHAKAYGAAAPFIRERDALKKQVEDLDFVLNAVFEINFKAFQRSEASLLAMETKEVAVASFGYSVWGNELAAITSHLPPGFGAVALPIFDVHMDAFAKTLTTHAAPISNGKNETSVTTTIQTVGTGEEVKPGVDENPSTPKAKTAFRDEKGNLIFTPRREVNNDAAGVLRLPITLGAYCRGNSTLDEETFFAPPINGNPIKFTGHKYVARINPKIEQQVALRYKFHVKAEPISVRCSLTVHSSDDFKRKFESSGFLFWRTKWTDVQRKLVKDLGVVCDVKDRPMHLNPEQMIQWENDILQTYSQEVIAQFVIENAAYTVTKADMPVLPDAAWSKAGPAMTMLCGSNFFCQVTNVVMHSLEALFGSQEENTKINESRNNTITREFNLDTFDVNYGSSLINVSVDVP